MSAESATMGCKIRISRQPTIALFPVVLSLCLSTLMVLSAAQPDLKKHTDSVSNLNPKPGDTITAYIVVTNQACSGGSAAAGAFHIGLYWSTNATFSGATAFYQIPVSGCSANGTIPTSQNININPKNTPGTYYFGYKIDDLDEVVECLKSNNGIFYWKLNLQSSSNLDFAVTSISLSPSVPQPGQPFTAYIKVKNQGAISGSGGWLDVWSHQLSVPACETDGNAWAGIGTLTPGQTNTIALTLTAPATPGSYTFRAFADSCCQVVETNESNNHFTLSYNVAAPAQLPDFLISGISLSPASPQPGQAFTAYVTVKNQGAAAAAGGWLDAWTHQPTVQPCRSNGNSWAGIGTLAAGTSKTYMLSLTAPGAAGTYTFRSFADSYCQTAESNETNNQTTLSYTVVTSPPPPDFLVTAISLSPSSPQPGQAVTATVTVKNQGAGPGAAGWLEVWANQASAPACGTSGNAWAAVGTLTVGQTKSLTLSFTSPAAAGSYTFRTFVDSFCQTAESNETNNQSTLAYTVAAPTGLPDFVVTAISFTPTQPIGGQPFTAKVTVTNQGAGPGNGRWLDVWVNQPSAQSCGASGDQYQSLGTLTAGQSVTKTFSLTAPASGAPWNFRAFVDSGCQTAESNDANNQTTVSYGVNPVQPPDFAITSISLSPSNLKPGDKFTAYVTVKNLGAQGDAGWLDVWANKPATAACNESGDSYSAAGTLPAGQSKTVALANLTAVAGNNTLRAFVDSGCQTTESNEGNNQSTLNYAVGQRVLLLLHGMNSGPEAWNDFVQTAFNNSAPIIYGGTCDACPIPDSHGVLCYRVQFGYYDATSGLTGLEGVSATTATSGDFSTFDTLGTEVSNAVNYVLSLYPNAQVTLVGHSRGGLAARAFMQTATSSPEKNSIAALLTTGTPHRGSQLGRIYAYLATHPRTTDSANYWRVDWEVADTVRSGLDVRRPTVDDLSNSSAAIGSLNSTVAYLPTTVHYGAITYSGVNIGLLQRDVTYKGIKTWVDYSIFSDCNQTYHWVGPKVSAQGEAYMLGSGNSPMTSPGDGIVPLTSQTFFDLSGFPATANSLTFTHNGSVIHTEEPGQQAHISDALTSLVNWWQ